MDIKTTVENGKTYAHLKDLKEWSKNPRSIKAKDFKRLKKQLSELGQHTPSLITADGTVLGGNMRLKAMRELNWDLIWVSLVEADTEEDKMKYALSSNDRAGFYDEDLLANLTGEFPDFEWGDYAVDVRMPATLDDLINPKTFENEEISTKDLQKDLNCICPKCGFEFKQENV